MTKQELSPEIIAFLNDSVNQIFQEFDTDNSGYLDREEAQKMADQLALGLQAQGHSIQPSNFDETFDEFDANGDGKLSRKELKEFIHLFFINLLNIPLQ